MPLQFVLEFGTCMAGSLVEIAKGLIPTPASVEVLYTDKTSYEPLSDSRADLSTMVTEGTISSFSLRPCSGPIRYVLGLCPHFDGEKFSCWLGTVEFVSFDYVALWQHLLARRDLLFVCLGFEEGVSIEEQDKERWFSWDDPTLVVGAIWRSDGRCEMRHGVKYDEVQVATTPRKGDLS